ncbi:metallophosphoesterase, family [Limihaloglobus sulfuriphilus]|uniref:Metallophosphoesterase, family n=1 Tax=Limihaloglobus sulfuriphilus TaxID=1851148 RepID=A0A1Q2MBW9_9BACT|nr:metallophosphoesterase [Limihaloglobus sulfuriphilus]AQQ70225.1 metallophosphoesterase, family [Limihaloglobus sulfuriphilus]
MENLSRRKFIKYSGLAGGAFLVGGCGFARAQTSKAASGDVLKGFIVSDAHFGWVHDMQPTHQQQRDAMNVILTRFPDLDVFIDTGDAHHSGLSGSSELEARGGWTDIIANGSGRLPFYYVMGNHEAIPNPGLDSEQKVQEFGSVTCRPYYSFDIKNIHFVSLPELETPVFVNKESIDWLKLDLELNKDKTTILLSHNNIKGTTTLLGDQPGYRGITNSQQIMDIISGYPNVISWMQGHNHTYEVVKKDNMLFVSNGRIGGFIPGAVWGLGHRELGGIYFEVLGDKFIVKSFSASSNSFHEELGFELVSGELEKQTTLDSSAKSVFSYGVGDMNNGQKIPVFSHHTGLGKKEIFAAAGSEEINDDPEFTLFEHRHDNDSNQQWMLMGASVGYPRYFEPENTLWQWEDPGIRLLAQESLAQSTDISVPEYASGRNAYYKCSPGRKYKTEITINSPSGGQNIEMLLEVRDSNGNSLNQVTSEQVSVEAGTNKYSREFYIPHLPDTDNIYYDNSSDTTVQVLAKAKISNLFEDVVVSKFALYHSELAAAENPKITVDGKQHLRCGKYGAGEVISLGSSDNKEARAVVECSTGGTGRLSWLIRQDNVDWQFRNAAVSDLGQYLQVDSVRSPWTPDKEVVIAPFGGSSGGPFVHKTRKINQFNIYPLNRGNELLKIDVQNFDSDADIKIICSASPAAVTGSSQWSYESGVLTVNVESEGVITADWA